ASSECRTGAIFLLLSSAAFPPGGGEDHPSSRRDFLLSAGGSDTGHTDVGFDREAFPTTRQGNSYHIEHADE
ncbi:MAG: hypothetical protein ACI4TL_03455, partial [Candidatus Cryptobacteroides sp.]